jgi:cyclopropane fatty-acyl-phospholipid synthase-like methyltransferase
MDLRNILKNPLLYSSYQKLVGGYRARRKFVEDHLHLKPTHKLLDFGCGPGDILEFLPEVNYTGIDIDPVYIERARLKYGHRARFECSTLKELHLEEKGSYDYVIATGVLHHMNDENCHSFLRFAQSALKPSGKIVTLDGCYIPDQNRVSKFLLDNDRGEYVRTPESYLTLLQPYFNPTRSVVEETYFHIPYTLFIMEGTIV